MCRGRRPLQGEWPEGVLALAADAERSAARGEHSERDHGRQKVRDERRRVQNVLEVVEEQQRGTAGTRRAHAPRQVGKGDVRGAEGLGHRGRDEGRIANRCQPHKDHPHVARVGSLVRDLQREPRLADAARPHQCQHPWRWTRAPVLQDPKIGLAADQCGERLG